MSDTYTTAWTTINRPKRRPESPAHFVTWSLLNDDESASAFSFKQTLEHFFTNLQTTLVPYPKYSDQNGFVYRMLTVQSAWSDLKHFQNLRGLKGCFNIEKSHFQWTRRRCHFWCQYIYVYFNTWFFKVSHRWVFCWSIIMWIPAVKSIWLNLLYCI